MKNIFKVAAVGVLLVGVSYWALKPDKQVDVYVTQKVVKGDITEKITATGTINPISTVNIGTQVSGTISEILVDYNTKVTKGQLLAQIDPALFRAEKTARGRSSASSSGTRFR